MGTSTKKCFAKECVKPATIKNTIKPKVNIQNLRRSKEKVHNEKN